MGKKKTEIQFVDKTPALARFAEVARFDALSMEEKEQYVLALDDYVIMQDVLKVKYQDGKEYGEKIGYKRGVKDTTNNIARMMKQKGYSVDTIAEITGLPVEEIERL